MGHGEADALAGAREHDGATERLDRPARIDVPVGGRRVGAAAAHEVRDDHEVVVQRQHTTAMLEGRIAVVRAVEEIERVVRAPGVDARVRDMGPMKRAARNRLRPLVDGHRVVQRRRSHAVAHRRIDRVARGARIDQQRQAAHRHRQRQCVGVRVPAVPISMRPAVDDDVLGSRPYHVVAGLRQRARARRLKAGGWRLVTDVTQAVRHPDRFLRRRTDLQIVPAGQRRGDRQAVTHVVRRAAGDREQRAAVVVTNVGQAAAIVGKQPRRSGQPRHGVFEPIGRRVAVEPRDDEREDVEVERIPVIVRRALGMAAVRADLPFDLIEENPAAERLAAGARRE